MKSFICKNCGKRVNKEAMGTHHRNHCPFCLWSLHVDREVAGDRDDICHGLMEPIGLTFKHEGVDKYGQKKQGELMLVHRCQRCGKVSINRVAGDDDSKKIMEVFGKSLLLGKLPQGKEEGIIVLVTEKDMEEVKRQLFGEK